MVFSSRAEEYVFNELTHGSRTAMDLALSTDNISQATIYRAIESLLKQSIIVKVNGALHISAFWIAHMKYLVDTVSHSYAAESKAFELSEGEKLSYTFSNHDSLEKFWNHVELVMMKERVREPLYCVETSPYWWYITSGEEQLFLSELSKSGRVVHMCFHESEPIADSLIQRLRSYDVKIARISTTLRPGAMYHIFGEYVIEVIYPQTILEEINALCDDKGCNDPQKVLELTKSMHTIKFTIMRSKKKSDEWKKRLGKYFEPLDS